MIGRPVQLIPLCVAILGSLCYGLSPTEQSSGKVYWGFPRGRDVGRRVFVASCSSLFPASARASAPSSPRSVDVGGGVDLFMEIRMPQKDVLFPISMEGIWVCDRMVTQVEGDSFQAETAWHALGGIGTLKPGCTETYQTSFIRSPFLSDSGVVADRSFEIASRTNSKDVKWDAMVPDTLKYDNIKLKVVQRSVELPSDKGFGSNELVSIDDGQVLRAAQVKRRFRRAFDENGGRLVEGLEIIKTFRVLDGVAGVELPTSVTKSQIRLRRPQ